MKHVNVEDETEFLTPTDLYPSRMLLSSGSCLHITTMQQIVQKKLGKYFAFLHTTLLEQISSQTGTEHLCLEPLHQGGFVGFRKSRVLQFSVCISCAPLSAVEPVPFARTTVSFTVSVLVQGTSIATNRVVRKHTKVSSAERTGEPRQLGEAAGGKKKNATGEGKEVLVQLMEAKTKSAEATRWAPVPTNTH